MSNLVPANLSQLPSAPENAPTPAEMIDTSSMLPYIQLLQGQSSLTATPDADFKPGQFVLPKGGDDAVNLGPSFDAVPLAYRYKAIDFSGDSPVIVYDPNDPEFKRIKENAKAKKQDYNSGIEILFWIDSEKTFATLGCTNNTMAGFAVKDVVPRMRQPITVKSKFIDPPKSKYSWYGAQAYDSQTEIVNLPEMNVLTATVEKFLHPDAAEEEEVPI